MEGAFKLHEVPFDRRYWVVRADDGEFFEHFIEHSVAAIGHLDQLNIPANDEPYFPDIDDLEIKLARAHRSLGHGLAYTTNHLNQVRNFVYGAKVGDWLIAVGSKQLRVGRIIGAARIQRSSLRITSDETHQPKAPLSYNLRRKINWGPALNRSFIPYGLRQSFKSNITFFSIDKHWSALCHTLFPIFFQNDELYFTANIRTQSEIRNYDLTLFLRTLSEIEAVAKWLENGSNLDGAFSQKLRSLATAGDLTLSVSANFASPGEIWSKLKVSPTSLLIVWAGYGMLFGNEVLGLDGILDLQTRQKMWEIVLERFEENSAEEVMSNLDIRLPSYDTSKLESSIEDEVVTFPDTEE